MKKSIAFCLFAITFAAHGQTYTVETVPNTKLINNSYVSNPDRILSESGVGRINYLLGDLEQKTTVQVAVVMLGSIGSEDIFDFAQRLFEKWGVGQKGNNNGLLILYVGDQRTIRFHTGYGLESVLPDALCKRIQLTYMVPHFRDGEIDEGMVSGIRETASVIQNPNFSSEMIDDAIRDQEGWDSFFAWTLIGGALLGLIWFFTMRTQGRFSDYKAKDPQKKPVYPEMALSQTQWLTGFVFIPGGMLIVYNFLPVNYHIYYFLATLYVYFILTLIVKRLRMRPVVKGLSSRSFHSTVQFLQFYQVYWLWMGILFPVPMLFHYFFYRWRIRYFRNHPRPCKTCGLPLRKLNEKEDDKYLKKDQLFEEQLKSVDYDVWVCSSCGPMETLNYNNLFSKYDNCPKCRTRAYHFLCSRTLVSPTYDSSGEGEKTYSCKYCNHKTVTKYTIAKLTRSSDSSSSDSSSSSGGSWGGGSSGGGGASSSW